MPAYIKDSGVWKESNGINVKDSGTWKTTSNGYVKDSGVWKEFFSSGPTFSASLLGTLPFEGGGSQSQARPKIAQTSSGGVILATANRNSVYRSTNNGSSWSQTFNGAAESTLTYGHGSVFINDAGTHAVASPRGSNYGKIIYSSNGGQSWTTKVTTNDSVYAGTYDQTTGIVMLGDRGQGGGSSSDLNRSSDHGQSWSVAIDSNQSDHNNVGMKKGSAGNAVSWATSIYYTSTNGGASWTQQSTPSGHNFTSIHYVVFDSTGKYYYAQNSSTNVLSATTLTGARTATNIGSTGNVNVVQIDDADIIYVGTSAGEIYYSMDYGATYQEITEWATYHTAGTAVEDINTNNSSGRFLVGTYSGSGNIIHVLQKS